MAEPASVSDTSGKLRSQLGTKYVRWGGLAAMLGPLLVVLANIYNLWRTVGAGPEGVVEAAMTTPFVVFGGFRLLGGLLWVFGLIALYAYQVEEAGRLGVVGFVVSMIGTVLLTSSAWFQLFYLPGMAAEVPAFAEAARAAEVGPILLVGLIIPLVATVIGWLIFGIATYRAQVFPRSAAVLLIIGVLLLLVPKDFTFVFQLAVAWLGFLLFSGRLEPPSAEEMSSPTQ